MFRFLFISLLTVDLLTSISFAMAVNGNFFLRHTEIVYLCSLVRCLYFFIGNTKVVTLPESTKFLVLFFFYSVLHL